MLIDDLDPLGHLGIVQDHIEQLRMQQRAQSRIAGYKVGAYGIAYRRRNTAGKPADAPSGEVILFGLDAAERPFAMRFLPEEAEAFIARFRGQSNLARGLPAEGVGPSPHEQQSRQLGDTVLQLMDNVPKMAGVDAGYFEVPYGEGFFSITIRALKKCPACFANQPCASTVCEHPDRGRPQGGQ